MTIPHPDTWVFNIGRYKAKDLAANIEFFTEAQNNKKASQLTNPMTILKRKYECNPDVDNLLSCFGVDRLVFQYYA
jgi:hypothetical protein